MKRSMAMGCALTGVLVGSYGPAMAEGDVDAGAEVHDHEHAEAARGIGFGCGPDTVEAGRAQIEMKLADAAWERHDDVTERRLALGGFDVKFGVTDRVDAEVGFVPWIQTDAGEGEGWSTGAISDTELRLKVNLTGYDRAFGVAVVPRVVIATAGEGMGAESTAFGVTVPVAIKLPAHFQLVTGVDAVTVPEPGMADDVKLGVNLGIERHIAGPVLGFVEGHVATEVREPHAHYTAHAGTAVAVGSDAEVRVGASTDPTSPSHRFASFVAVTVRH
jgi:hypothetical protein